MFTPAHALKEANESLATFEATYPEVVLASVNLYGEIHPTTGPTSTVDTSQNRRRSYQSPCPSLKR